MGAEADNRNDRVDVAPVSAADQCTCQGIMKQLPGSNLHSLKSTTIPFSAGERRQSRHACRCGSSRRRRMHRTRHRPFRNVDDA